MANVFIEETTLTAIGEAIRAKTGKTDLILPANMVTEISGITGGGGESTDLVKYVTFLAEDGSELYKMPVLNGDDCKDPVNHGDIEAPTKESTNTNNYTHSGWTSAVGGEADSSILEAITEDKTVYAAFAVSIRYYTVTFYDDDGTTVLNTVQATYGANVSDYMPAKDGYSFVSWNPSPTNVTADMFCVAVWEEGIKFSTASWEQISEICEAGEAAQYFAVGDTKTIKYKNSATSATEYETTVKIIALNHDDKADGSGKAGITCRFTRNFTAAYSSGSVTNVKWSTNKIRTEYYATTFLSLISSDLVAVVKPVTKKTYSGGTYETTTDTFWDLSAGECGFVNYPEEGSMYPIFVEDANKDVTTNQNASDLYLSNPTTYRLRTRVNINYSFYITEDDSAYKKAKWVTTSTSYDRILMPCFCV